MSALCAGSVLQDEAFIHVDGVVTKSVAKPARNLVFIELEAVVEAVAVPGAAGAAVTALLTFSDMIGTDDEGYRAS